MTQPPQVQIVYVNPKKLKRLPSKNPNVMEPAVLASLTEVIRNEGFLQPILVVEEDGEYVIIDGVHRSTVAVTLKLKTIPAVVAPDRARAEVLRLALNKLRGELDVVESAKQMQALLDSGLTREDLTFTGFQDWEVETMLDGMDFDAEDELDGAVVTPIAPDRPKTYALNFTFKTESERAKAKEALEAAGDGNAMNGLLHLILTQTE